MHLRHVLPRLSRAFALLVLLVAAAPAGAIEMCVGNTAQLQAAFVVGSVQSQPFTIKLVQGTYTLSGDTTVNFSAPTTLLGGYTANCAARGVNPANTAIDVGGSASTLFLSQQAADPRARLGIDGLTIANAKNLVLAAGLYNMFSSNDPGDVVVTRSHFYNLGLGLAGNDGVGPLRFLVTDGRALIENVLIESLPTADINGCSVVMAMDGDAQASLNYVTVDLSNAHDLCVSEGVSHSASYQVDIHNSIVWASDGTLSAIHGTDFSSQGNSFAVTIGSSILHTYYGIGSVSSSNNLNTNPKWVDPANANYRLQATSPAVNSGSVLDPLGTPGTDIAGGARWIGTRPDRGAYESTVNDLSAFEVKSVADAGPNTLRQAILDANSSSNPATIKFNIAAPCPAVIGLASALPHITSPIIIDGYTQPGSAPNIDADAFNAKLCVLLKPAVGTLPSALQVPAGAANASLVVRGLGFGGFGQPVMLLGGFNHVIAGNQFGGSVGGVVLPGAGLQAISIGVNAGGSLAVGGQSVADRNVIGGGGFYGINVQSTVGSTPDLCQITNNLIGVAANGFTPLPNFTGIGLAGNGCAVTSNRIVGNSHDAILINGGSGNVIQRNVIGVGINGNGMLNSGAGVHITSGSGNVIGSSALSNITGTLLSNTIRFMVDGGVVAEAGAGNSIRSNLIHDNGATGTGMDIDLAPLGPTPNDAGDIDSGPNMLQNFPLGTGVAFTTPPAPNATQVPANAKGMLDAQPGSYRVDAYFANGCNTNGRGHAQAYVGATQVTIAVGATRANFTLSATLPNVAGNGMLALTTTDSVGNTSEIGPCMPVDAIFLDGNE